jgi:hypothetical protein
MIKKCKTMKFHEKFTHLGTTKFNQWTHLQRKLGSNSLPNQRQLE